MTYRVELSAAAEADLARVIGWLASRSPGAARRLADRFDEALTRLETNPDSCGLAFENGAFPEEIRHLLFGHGSGKKHRALFAIRGDEVVIIAIRAPGERPLAPGDLDEPY